MACSALCFLYSASSPSLRNSGVPNQLKPVNLLSLTKQERRRLVVIRSSENPTPTTSEEEKRKEATPFGYSRKDVLLIGVGVTVAGLGLESGLEYVGVDPLQAGNAVQLVMVLGLTVGWILSYVFRVSNKEMTYAQQLRDYEYKVMEKRLEGLTEAELTALMEQVEEEKRQLANGKKML